MRAMIDALQCLGCRVTFLSDELVPWQPYTRALRSMGVEVLFPGVEAEAELGAIGTEIAVAIVCRPHPASRWLDTVRQAAPRALVAYDTVDLHWLRVSRQAALCDGDGSLALVQQANALRAIELALVRASDVALVVSDAEREHLLVEVPDADVRVLPNVNQERAEAPAAASRAGVLFVGGFYHDPNLDAVRVLLNEVMPRLWQQLGPVKLSIVGESPPAEVQRSASDLVTVTGWVPDIDPVLDRARLLVAPLRYGAGLKGKITQAMAAGLPVVTTPVGAEGLDAIDGEHLLIAEDPEGIAEATARVLNDDALWGKLSRGGRQHVATRCSPRVMERQLEALLEDAARLRQVDAPGRAAEPVALR